MWPRPEHLVVGPRVLVVHVVDSNVRTVPEVTQSLMADDFDAYDAVAVLIRRPAWHRQAACRGRIAELPFFPAMGESTAPARAVCHGCPVQTECLDAALAEPLTQGLWADTSERDRRRLRAERQSGRRDAA
jgi:WhiB family redox-sensing transcriptional regulator